MESIINSIASNKILMIIIILLISLLIYSILKQLVKIIVITIIALALYLGYMSYKGEKIDNTLQDYLNKGGKELKEIQKKKDAVNRMLESAEEIRK